MSFVGPFAPLNHDRFRALWLAGLVSFLGTWVHNVAARWTATTLSASPMVVATVDTLQLLPMVLLSLAAGSLADRTDRRQLLVVTHAGLATVAGMRAIFAWYDALALTPLYALTACIGLFGALNGPAWQATVPRQVPDEEVPRAVVLMSTGWFRAVVSARTTGCWTGGGWTGGCCAGVWAGAGGGVGCSAWIVSGSSSLPMARSTSRQRPQCDTFVVSPIWGTSPV